jgi:aspartyl-tRNA(Asn)/glutamyl-tRNA(Gln) amidotransferase subunit C
MKREELLLTARLAQISLGEEELEILEKEISRMLEYFRMMEKVDISGLEPTAHAILEQNRTRKDGAEEADSSDVLLEKAPELEDRFIVIPNVL